MQTTDGYQTFLDRVSSDVVASSQSPVARLYHLVRRIPYGRAGQRDPRIVYEDNVGTCSGKHILLRDLLRHNGFPADVITIFTFFNKGIPVRPEFPAELQRMIQEVEVCDFHHYVQVETADGTLRLDATWHDFLIDYGFPVNAGWNGRGDTQLAAGVLRNCGPAEDVAAYKLELLAGLTDEQSTTRQRFFDLLTGWIAEKEALQT